MTKFHSDDYIRFLRSIRPDNMSEYNKQMQRCKFTCYCYIRIRSQCALNNIPIEFISSDQVGICDLFDV